MNKVILIGNLANDPEAFTTQNGVSRSTFRLAVQRKYANAQGVREADFFTIVAWRASADFCNRYLTKGRKVAVEGSLQPPSDDAQAGPKRYVTEINAESVEAAGGKAEGNGSAGGNGGSGQQRQQHGGNDAPPDYPAPPMSGEFQEVEDDEPPF